MPLILKGQNPSEGSTCEAIAFLLWIKLTHLRENCYHLNSVKSKLIMPAALLPLGMLMDGFRKTLTNRLS